jgi:hypothetical protein
VFLTHHDFVVDEAREVFGAGLNVVTLPPKDGVERGFASVGANA